MFNHIGPLSNNFVGRLLHAHASPLTQNCFTNPSQHSHSFVGYNSGELWKSFQDLSRKLVQPVISFESNIQEQRLRGHLIRKLEAKSLQQTPDCSN